MTLSEIVHGEHIIPELKAANRWEAIDELVDELVDSGAIKPQVSAVVPLAEAISAYNLSQTGHVRGKVVLRVR